MRDLLGIIISTSIAECQPHTRPWTRDENQFLTENLGRLSVEQCGQELGRSKNAVKVHYTRLGLLAPSRQHAFWLSGNMVANLLSIYWKTFALIAKRKILPVFYQGEFMRVKRISLYVWAINPENWIYFKIGRVRDPHLRRLIELRRKRWNDEWLTVGQAERICNWDRVHFIAHFIRRGRLPAKKWDNWHIKLSDLRTYLQNSSRKKYVFSARADEFILKARDEWHLKFPTIERMMKIDQEKIRKHYWKLKMKNPGTCATEITPTEQLNRAGGSPPTSGRTML